MSIKLWPGYWKNQLESMNITVDEENGKYVVMVKVQSQEVWRFLRYESWKNIGYHVSVPAFGLGGLRLWEEEEAKKMSVKKGKRCSIRVKVDLYEFCLS